MNKLIEFQQSPLLSELKHLQRLNRDKLMIERAISGEFRHTRHKNNNNKPPPNKFRSHPKRLCSDSDTTVSYNNSPRNCSLSSSRSDLALSKSLEENKLKIKNSRRKLYNNKLSSSDEKYNKGDYIYDLNLRDSLSTIAKNKDTTSDDDCDSEDSIKPKKPSIVYPLRKSSQTKNTQNIVLQQHTMVQKIIITDSMFEKKFKLFVEKSLHVISDIRSLMDKGIDPPDGDEDISRRHLRVREFSNRFSRNYLYPIVRQLEDLSKLKMSNPNLNQKLLSAYQVILSGLQAYQNHLPSSIGDCSSDKLKQLLKHLLELCELHSNIFRDKENLDINNYTDFISAFKLNAELMMQKIEDFTGKSTDSVLKSTVTKISLAAQNQPKIKKTQKPKSTLAERLSMYSTPSSFRKDPAWRKAAENLAKRKFNVKSRYKTASLRHRPPIEKNNQQQSHQMVGAGLVSKSKQKVMVTNKKSMGNLRKKTPIDTPINEDNITTLIEMENNNYNNNNNGGQNQETIKKQQDDRANHQDMVVRLLQLVLNAAASTNNDNKNSSNNNNKGGATIRGGDLVVDEAVPKEGNTNNNNNANDLAMTLRKIVDELDDKMNKNGNLEMIVKQNNTNEDQHVETPSSVKKRKEPKITVTGARNAKLICITDENSIEEEKPIEIEDKNQPVETPTNNNNCENFKQETDTDSSVKSVQKPIKSRTVKLKRSTKTSKTLNMLTKDYALSIIQYKLDFHKYCKGNPMYRRTENMVPWKLVGKISDAILNLSLLGVAKEIELTDVVEQIYQSELQM